MFSRLMRFFRRLSNIERYGFFATTIGLIVDLAAIIAFIGLPRFSGGSLYFETSIDDAFALMAIALVYSLGYLHSRIYKYWQTKLESNTTIEHNIFYDEDETYFDSYEEFNPTVASVRIDRKIWLAVFTIFPVNLVYNHAYLNATSQTPLSLWGAIIITLFTMFLSVPLVMIFAQGFDVILNKLAEF